jgi:hypothetical protein
VRNINKPQHQIPYLGIIRLFTSVMLLFAGASLAAGAEVLFSDDLKLAPSPLWGNQSGNWVVSDGGYRALNSFAPDITCLPYVLTNFAVDVDINRIADGGIWLRCDTNGRNGVLLVTGGLGWGWGAHGPGQQGRSLYWHVIRDGQTGPVYGCVQGLFEPEASTAHFHIEVHGDVYEAYLNGSKTPVTTIVNSDFASGRAGLYDFSVQSFNNFVLTGDAAAIPPPPAPPPPVKAPAVQPPPPLPVLVPTVRPALEAAEKPASVVLSNIPPPMVSISTAVEIYWPSQPGALYQVQWSSSSGGITWTNLGEAVQATDTNTSVFDSIRQGASKFYRVQVL